MLVDGHWLADLMIEHRVGVSRRILKIGRMDTDYFEEGSGVTEPPGRVELPPRLDEFRTALEEEIKAAARNAASNAIGLRDGRRVSEVAGGFQYVFQADGTLNLPGDAPGDLRVPGRAPIEVTVVCVEGLSVTLSLPEDLGEFVAEARLVSDLTHLMRILIQRIEESTAGTNHVGDRLLDAGPVHGEVSAWDATDYDPPLNCEQVKAVGSSLGRDLTFVWGDAPIPFASTLMARPQGR